MRGTFHFLLGVLTAMALTHAVGSAPAANTAFQIVERDEWLFKWHPYDQTIYLEGVSDALTYVTPDLAAGEGLSKCYRAVGFDSGVDLISPLRSELKRASSAKTLPGVLLQMLKRDCKEFMK